MQNGKCKVRSAGTSRWLVCLSLCVFALTGCKLEQGPGGRAVRVLPAILGDPRTDPLAIRPDWAPRLPDRPGGRPEEVVGLTLFDHYVFPGEPVTGLLRINRHNLPGRLRVHLEVWDEAGLNILWQSAVRVQPGEVYLVQIAPLAGEAFVDQTLQIRVRAKVFQVTERVAVLPRPPAPPAMAPLANRNPEALAAGAFPLPPPAGPVGPNDEPITLVTTPGERVGAVAVLWPNQFIEGVSTRVSDGPLNGSTVQAIRQPTSRADERELMPGVSNVFVMTTPPIRQPGSYAAQWEFTDSAGLLLARPIALAVLDLPILPASPGRTTAQARYLATLEALIRAARDGGNFQQRLAADRIEKFVDRAADHYARQPAGPLFDQLADDQRFPLKLRWIILHAIEQLHSAGVPTTRVE